MENVRVKADDLKKLMNDVAEIKDMLLAEKKARELEEIELTDWAKKELEMARARKLKVSNEKARALLFAK